MPRRDSKMSVLLNSRYVVSADHSRWDLHVSCEALMMEFQIYQELIGEDVMPFLQYQLETHAFHVNGVYYSLTGGRCSGDVNTSLGNWIINLGIMLTFGEWDSLFIEGDDMIGGIDHVPEGLVQHCLSFGFTTVSEVSTDVMDHVFCGRALMAHTRRLVSFCDLARTLPKLHLTKHTTDDVERIKSLALAKALSYRATDSHTPIIWAWCAGLIRRLVGVMPEFDSDTAHRLRMGPGTRRLRPPFRHAIDHIYGIPKWQQLQLERLLLQGGRLPYVPLPFGGERNLDGLYWDPDTICW